MLKVLKFTKTGVNITQEIFLNGCFIPLNAELYPICHLLALLGAHHILHVGRIIVNYGHTILFILLIRSLVFSFP